MKKVFDRMAALVRECCDPDEVLLFGSFAKGIADVNSDIDLMVIGEFGTRKQLFEREVSEALGHFPLKIDVLFLSPQDVQLAGSDPKGFLGSALSTAKSIYRKAPKTG